MAPIFFYSDMFVLFQFNDCCRQKHPQPPTLLLWQFAPIFLHVLTGTFCSYFSEGLAEKVPQSSRSDWLRHLCPYKHPPTEMLVKCLDFIACVKAALEEQSCAGYSGTTPLKKCIQITSIIIITSSFGVDIASVSFLIIIILRKPLKLPF